MFSGHNVKEVLNINDIDDDDNDDHDPWSILSSVPDGSNLLQEHST